MEIRRPKENYIFQNREFEVRDGGVSGSMAIKNKKLSAISRRLRAELQPKQNTQDGRVTSINASGGRFVAGYFAQGTGRHYYRPLFLNYFENIEAI